MQNVVQAVVYVSKREFTILWGTRPLEGNTTAAILEKAPAD